MRLSILIAMCLFLVATLQGPAAGDPLPDETVAVVLNRSLEMVPVKGGCYKMGDDSGEAEEDEKPVHEVCLKDFSIGKYLVTQDQWIAVTGKNPSAHDKCGHTCPVENVSWNEVQE